MTTKKGGRRLEVSEKRQRIIKPGKGFSVKNYYGVASAVLEFLDEYDSPIEIERLPNKIRPMLLADLLLRRSEIVWYMKIALIDLEAGELIERCSWYHQPGVRLR